MPNRLKNRVAISTALDKELYERLKKYSAETSIPISKILDKSIDMYLKSLKR